MALKLPAGSAKYKQARGWVSIIVPITGPNASDSCLPLVGTAANEFCEATHDLQSEGSIAFNCKSLDLTPFSSSIEQVSCASIATAHTDQVQYFV